MGDLTMEELLTRVERLELLGMEKEEMVAMVHPLEDKVLLMESGTLQLDDNQVAVLRWSHCQGRWKCLAGRC